MRTGERIGDRFEIVSRAGAGGMGVVYRGRDVSSDRPVAIKVLERGSVGEHRRFAREAALLAELRHPGIVQYLDHGALESGAHYLVMEWVEGTTLRDRLRQGPLSLAESIEMGAEVAGALGAAHRLGVVHRDVKPGNLLLPGPAFSDAKLFDFGIARRLDPTSHLTATGSLLGTLLYMAPEQARDPRAVDARTDVYALGVVLFECIAGRRPFEAENAGSALLEVVFGETPRLRDIHAPVPEAVDELIRRMMDRDPDVRPAHGEAARKALLALGDLADVKLPRRSIGLTERERRLVSVLLLDCTGRAVAEPQTIAAAPESTTFVSDLAATKVMAPAERGPSPEESDDSSATLAAVADGYGGSVQMLPNGVAHVSFGEAGTGWDEHDRAALCALACRARLPRARLALAAALAVTDTDEWMIDVTGRAQAALARAEPGTIRLAPKAATIVHRRFWVRFDEHGGSLVGQRAAEHTAAHLLGHRPRCIGRRRELGTLQAIAEESASESVARVVLVTGGAGVGKSRLVTEFVEQAAAASDRVRVLLGRADWVAAGSPFSVAGTVVRRAASIVEGDELDLARRKLRSCVADCGLSPDLQEATVIFLGELARLHFAAEPGDALAAAREDPVLMGDRMRASWEDFFAAQCERQPVLLLLEDLHWADGPSLALVDAAMRHLADLPFMVVATARPEVREQFPDLWANRDLQLVRLAPLTKKASEQLLGELVSGNVPRDQLQAMAARSGGNPLYLEELSRTLAAGEALSLPDSLQGMLQARLDALGAETRRVLRAASVYGEVFWAEGVSALLGSHTLATQLEGVLDGLERSGVIRRSRASSLSHYRQYRFEHELLRAAAYEMLPDDDRSLGHQLAGEWLEQAGERDPGVLALHYSRGDAPERALPWLLIAAQHALTGNDLAEAVARVDEALSHDLRVAQLGELLLIKTEAHRQLGNYHEAEVAGRRALAALPEGTAKWFRAATETAAACNLCGQSEVATELLYAVQHTEPAADAVAAKVAALCLIGWSTYHRGERDASVAAIEQAERLVEQHQVDAPTALGWLHGVRAYLAFLRGDLAGYLLYSELAVQHLEAAGDLRGASQQRANLAVGYAQVGQYVRAAEVLAQVVADAERIGLRKVVAGGQLQLANTHLSGGRLEPAAEAANRSLQVATEIGVERIRGAAIGLLAVVAGREGELEEAERGLLQSVELLDSAPTLQADSLVRFAELRLQQGRPAEALQWLDRARKLAEGFGGMGPSEFAVELAHSKALAALGRADEARHCAKAAAARLRANAMAFSDDSVREGFLRRVPSHARLLELAEDDSE